MNGVNVIQNDIFHNCRQKIYPNGFVKTTVASRNIYKESGWEERRKEQTEIAKVPKPQSVNPISRNDSIGRAKKKVFDIAAMNDFEYFVTLTFDAKKIDRYSVTDVKRKLLNWLKNLVTRCGLKYLLIPERHKDGAIHLHGLVSGNITLSDSETVRAPSFTKPVRISTALKHGISLDECMTIYNLPQWSLGYSMAYATYGDITNCAKYITKYITKDIDKIFGNFYYAGGDIIRDVPFRLSDVDYESFKCDSEYYCEEISTSFKYAEEKGDTTDEVQ